MVRSDLREFGEGVAALAPGVRATRRVVAHVMNNIMVAFYCQLRGQEGTGLLTHLVSNSCDSDKTSQVDDE